MKDVWDGTAKQIVQVFQKIKEQKPLIHMIPNAVSAALCADGLSALGARPLMAVAVEEMAEITQQADVSVVNLGQLTHEKSAAAEQVLRCTAEYRKPVVLDPVGCGASCFRLQTVQRLLELPWQGIVKGNRSELYSIQQNQLTREGIDSIVKRELSLQIPKGRVYYVTGQEDFILRNGREQALLRPCEIREKNRYNIVGSGCLAGAITGACCSTAAGQEQEEALQLGAAAASFAMAFVLEQAERARGYGSAKTALLDGLCLLAECEFEKWLLNEETDEK